MSRIDIRELRQNAMKMTEVAFRLATWRWFLLNCHRFFASHPAPADLGVHAVESFRDFVAARHKAQVEFLSQLSDCVDRQAFYSSLNQFCSTPFAETTVGGWFRSPFSRDARRLTSENAQVVSLFFQSQRMRLGYRRIVALEKASLNPLIEAVVCELENRHTLKGTPVRDYLLLVWALNKRCGDMSGFRSNAPAKTCRELREKLDFGNAERVDVDTVQADLLEWIEDVTEPLKIESVSPLVRDLPRIWKTLQASSGSGLSFVDDCDDAFALLVG